MGLEILENGFDMRMCDFGGIFSEIYSFESYLYDFWILVVFGGNFCVLIIFKNGFGMRMCDFGGINLVKFIYLIILYIIFGFW